MCSCTCGKHYVRSSLWVVKEYNIIFVLMLYVYPQVKCHQYWPSNSEPATYGDYKVTVLKQEEIAKYRIRDFTIEKVRMVH